MRGTLVAGIALVCSIPLRAQVKMVAVLSDPPGAPVQLNFLRPYATPFVLQIDRGIWQGMPEVLLFRALPLGTGTCLQKKGFGPRDNLPDTLLFDLHHCTVGEGQLTEDTSRLGLLDRKPQRVGALRLEYPRALLQMGIEGDVVLEAVIDSLGAVDVSSIEVIGSNDDEFSRAAINALANSSYRPGIAGGHPVPVLIRVPIGFHPGVGSANRGTEGVRGQGPGVR